MAQQQAQVQALASNERIMMSNIPNVLVVPGLVEQIKAEG